MVPSLNGPIRDTLRMAADVRPSSSKISTYSGAAASNKRRPRAEEKKIQKQTKADRLRQPCGQRKAHVERIMAQTAWGNQAPLDGVE